MCVAKTVAFFALFLFFSAAFIGAAFAESPVIVNQKQQGLAEGCRGDAPQKKVPFLDENGDGLNDLVRDSDGDGVPDGKICNGPGYGAGRGAFYWQGGGGVMRNGAGRGFGHGFSQGRGRR